MLLANTNQLIINTDGNASGKQLNRIHPIMKESDVMNTENGSNNYLQVVLGSLIDEEISMVHEVYKLGEALEASLIPDPLSSADNLAWIERLNRLDLRIEDTLSRIVQREIIVIGKIENGLLKYGNPELGG